MTCLLKRLLASCLLIGVTAVSYAQDARQQVSEAMAAATQASVIAAKPADVRLVIDVSGSMKQNDPSNLRQPALELLVRLLRDDSRAGVWAFGKYINMLAPHKPVTDQWRAQANSKVTEVNSAGLFTNIGEALEKAAYDHKTPNPNFRTSIILLTDGMVDISRDAEVNKKEWQRIVDEVLPKLKQAGYTVHTIALSDNADQTLLNKLALQTDGIAAVAKNADELLKVFLQAFDQAAPAEEVPLEGNSFIIDSSIEEFTALIFRSPGSDKTRLISPDKTEYSFDREMDEVSWYQAQDYDLITVRRPLEGEWRVVADMAPDSRVTIVSNLNLLVKPLPSNLDRGAKLDVAVVLQDKGKTLTDTNFLRLLNIESVVTQADSEQDWRTTLTDGNVPENGIFTTQLQMFEKEGRYDLTIDVDGKSFKRRFTHHISVREPFGITTSHIQRDSATIYSISVEAFSPLIDPESLEVIARIKDPRGRSSIIPLVPTAADIWAMELIPEHDGVYAVQLRISGIDKNGTVFDFDPAPISITHPGGDNPFADVAAAQPEAVPEPVAVEIPVAEAPVVEPPVAEPVAVEPAAPEPEPEVAKTFMEQYGSWLLYGGLALGNILILVLAFFAYRVIMGGNDPDKLAELDEDNAESTAAKQNTADPDMEEVAPQAGAVIQPIEVDSPAATDSILADNLMSADLDLSSDASVQADLMKADSDVAAEAEDLLAELDMDDNIDDGFSLDDFDPDVTVDKDDGKV